MSRFSYYGSGQRLAFAMMFVGFILCLLGAVVPSWMKAEVKLSDLSLGMEKDIPFIGSLVNKLMAKYDLVKINYGVWVLCMEFVGQETKCYNMYSSDTETEFDDNDNYGDDGNSFILIVRFAIAINIKLSLICGLAACCRCTCCSGGRTICHGIFAFIAGTFGVCAFGIMAARKEDVMPGILSALMEIEYDWGFFVYGIGSGLMILSSLFLCFSMPRETPGAVVMMPMPAAAAPYVSDSSVNVNQIVNTPVNHYELNGQISSFEPLPEHPPPSY